MKLQDWRDIGSGWRLEQDERVAFETNSSGGLEVEARYTDYSSYRARDETVSHEVAPETLAEVLRLLGWSVSPPR